MQIARVVPKVRTQKEGVFDYAIPPELLPKVKPGILVVIPFHGRKIEGIVLDLKRSSPILKLSSIISVIDPDPVVDEIHIKIAQWMADYYLAPLGQTLFENIVPPAKRILKKLDFDDSSSLLEKRPTFGARAKKVGQRYLIVSDFKQRLNFYLKAIQRTLSKKRQVIVLVPDLDLISFFTTLLKDRVSIIHAGLTKTQRWVEWDKIRKDITKIIIGSTSALFAPTQNLGLIIIDQEENETYKNDRSPRFHAVKVAEKLCDLTCANLILGSITPKITTYQEALKGRFKILKSPQSPHRDVDNAKNTIVDMNTEKQAISIPLQNAINAMLQNNKKVLLVLNRKGEGTKFSCADCGWIASCEKCGLPLIPQKTNLICFRCEKNFSLPNICPKCQSIHLKPMGLGTTRLKKFVSDFWPQAKIIQIEKEKDGTYFNSNWDIAIVTNFSLKFNFPKIGLVGLIDADQSLNFPDFHSAEKTFQTFYKFLRIGGQGIIQTHLPENYVITNLAGQNFEKFFLDELENRKKANFPPFVQLIRLLYKNQNESDCKEKTQRIYGLLNKLIANNHPLITILGPSPAFIKKERDKFRYQIILKIKKRSKTLDDFLKTLPKGWIVDVDPVDLL